jgi:murein DD-endopeptidase MepM/ murein hydrolase activator NlpD
MRSRLLDYLGLHAVVFAALVPTLSLASTSSHHATTDVALRNIETPDRVALRSARASRDRAVAADAQVRPASGAVTSPYGRQRRHEVHRGIDIDGETGDPVVAAALGTVTHAGPAMKGYTGYGNLVVIDHGTYTTAYGHLSRVDVVEGQVVPAGEMIGAIGRSGIATGSHLHFEVRVDGKAVDPATIFHVL